MATISTHNGSKVARAHNIRDPKVVTKEAHIRPDGEHETWLDEAPRAAYERIFGEAVKAYNEKQTRDDRKISSYYDKIAGDAKKHVVYEMIVGVYGDGISDDLKKQILREHVDGWKERNPGLELIGAYWHNDEQGGAHVHLDYIPVARNCKRGMTVQTGLKAALGEMGIFGDSPKSTAQMLWQRQENEALERTCQRYGIQVEHPERGHGAEHLHTEAFKASQEAEKAVLARDNAQAEAEALRAENEALRASKIASEARTREAEAKYAEAEKAAQRATEELTALKKEVAEASKFVAEVEAVLEQGEKRKLPVSARIFQAATGLQQRFQELFKRESRVEEREREVAKKEKTIDLEMSSAKQHNAKAMEDRFKANALLARAWQQVHPIVTDAVRGVLEDTIQPNGMYNVFRNWLRSAGAGHLVDDFEQSIDAHIAKLTQERLEKSSDAQEIDDHDSR